MASSVYTSISILGDVEDISIAFAGYYSQQFSFAIECCNADGVVPNGG